MTSENNEYKLRREQRAEARKQREIARRRMIIRLVIAAVVIVTGALAIWLLVSDGNQNPTPPQIQIQPQDQNQPVATDAPTQPAGRPERTQIHVAVAGDLNVNTATVLAGKTGSGYDFAPVFLDVAPLLSNADITVMNFEGNLVGMPYGLENASAPQEMMQALADAGVDLVQMANSYSIRNGLLGLESTLEGIRAAGMEPLGAYADNAAYRESEGFTIREVDGVRVAFVAFTKGMGNLGLPAGSENCVNLLYEDYATTYQNVNEKKIDDILDAVRDAEPDFTIALLHWGSEYNDEHSSTQETIRDLLYQGGVDAIVGTHPHRVQAVEFDREAGTFVAYSLGDFFSDTVEAGSNYSVVLNLEITRDNQTGETKLTDYVCTPIYTMKPEESGRNGLRVVRTEMEMEAYDRGIFNRVSEGVYNSMAYTIERTNLRLNGEN